MRRILVAIAACVVLAGVAVPAVAHNLQGSYTFSDGCSITWRSHEFDTVFWAYTDKVNTCDQVQVTARYRVGSYWYTRTDTDPWYAEVLKSDMSEADYSNHREQTNGVWRGLTKKYH